MSLLPSIYWSTFTWEAFATIVTGVSAVGGAIFVGLRQAHISDKQAEILSKQAEVDEFRLRSELFDKRFAVYESCKRFVVRVVQLADEPEQDVQQAFLVAMDEARFLFRPSVHADLDEIWKRSCSAFANKKEMKASYDRIGEYGQERIEREYEYMMWILGKLDSLTILFGDELRLGQKP